jgi:hypothetical protein
MVAVRMHMRLRLRLRLRLRSSAAAKLVNAIATRERVVIQSRPQHKRWLTGKHAAPNVLVIRTKYTSAVVTCINGIVRTIAQSQCDLGWQHCGSIQWHCRLDAMTQAAASLLVLAA